MLTALVLVCSLALTPDISGCSRENAVQVLNVPSEFTNPATCFMHGQAYLAQTTIGRDLGAQERVKIVCTRAGALTTRVNPESIR
jgi:hypothetical protein